MRGALPVPAGAPSRTRELVDENAPRGHATSPSTSWSTPASSPRTATSTSWSSTPRPSPTTSSSASRSRNRGPEPAPLHLLPTLWFRNTWSWGRHADAPDADRRRRSTAARGLERAIRSSATVLRSAADGAPDAAVHRERDERASGCGGAPNAAPLRQGRHPRGGRRRRARRRSTRRGPARRLAAHYALTVAPGATRDGPAAAGSSGEPSGPFAGRRRRSSPRGRPRPTRSTRRWPAAPLDRRRARSSSGRRSPACSGASSSTTTTSREWLDGDPASRRRRPTRRTAATATGAHLNNADVLSMPDKWEYPWFAAWDLAFHCVPLAAGRPGLRQAASSLTADPRVVHAPERPAAGLRVGVRRRQPAGPRLGRLARLQDRPARSAARPTAPSSSASSTSCCSTSPGGSTARTPRAATSSRAASSGSTTSASSTAARRCPTGGHLEQADGTAWMGMFCLNMLRDRARAGRATNPVYEDIATKFFEHFLYIAERDERHRRRAAFRCGTRRTSSSTTCSHLADGRRSARCKVRSLVGLIPLLAVETIEPDLLERLPALPAPAATGS